MTLAKPRQDICDAPEPLLEIQRSIARLSGKWTLAVLFALWPEPRRFAALQRAVDGISKHVLSTTLRALEREGLVQRTVRAAVPPEVTYALTANGEALQPVFAAIIAWSSQRSASVAAIEAGTLSRA